MFTQERIKRQIEELQERVSGAPTDISDLRDRIEDIERDAVKAKSGGGSTANQSDMEAMRRDLNKILGRDESGTAEVDGIPTLVSTSRFSVNVRLILIYRVSSKNVPVAHFSRRLLTSGTFSFERPVYFICHIIIY